MKKSLIIVLVIGIIIISGWFILTKQEDSQITEKQAIKIASQTEQVKEFLKLYPNAIVKASFGQARCMGCEPEWSIAYYPREIESGNPQNDEYTYSSRIPDAHVTFLSIALNEFGDIIGIPDISFIKNEKHCGSPYDCYPINYPMHINCVNRIHTWKIQKELKTQPLFHCEINGVCYVHKNGEIDYSHRQVCDCINNTCTFIKIK